MKFYYSPGACSLGTHILLEESGLAYESVPTPLRENAQLKPAYLAINPKGKVPCLVLDDGASLTEWMAIATYIAGRSPETRLIPSDALGRARAEEVCSYVLTTMHLQGFARVFRPERFSPLPEGEPAARAFGEQIFRTGIDLMDRQLEGREWAIGPYSIADAALFYVGHWATGFMKWTLPDNMAAHRARMKARPAVARALADEGLA